MVFSEQSGRYLPTFFIKVYLPKKMLQLIVDGMLTRISTRTNKNMATFLSKHFELGT